MKRINPHDLTDMLNGERLPGQPKSRQITRIIDRALTQSPRMSSARQSRLEMEIRDEIGRRRGNRVRWPF